jgi:hypothetical protein
MKKVIVIQWAVIAILLLYGVAATMAFENAIGHGGSPQPDQGQTNASATTSTDQQVIQVASALGGWLGGPIGGTQREIADSARQFVRMQQQFCRDEGLGPRQEKPSAPLYERNRCATAFSVTV